MSPFLYGCRGLVRPVTPAATTPLAPFQPGPLQGGGSTAVDLPAGFRARTVMEAGTPLSDGFLSPMYPSGMSALPAPDGRTLLVRNHQIPPGVPSRTGPFGFQNHLLSADVLVYDAGADGAKPAYAAVTTLVYDTRLLWTAWSSLRLGGLLDLGGGTVTPWGSWLCGEGTVQTRDDRYGRDHGFLFDVSLSDRPRAEPLRALGRFQHASVAVDPRTGIVYQTEAQPDGLVYRFLPSARGDLRAGGQLQALATDTDLSVASPAQPSPVRWVDLGPADRPGDDLRLHGRAQGATPVAEGSGLSFYDGSLWITTRSGGGSGQLWRYTPSPHEGLASEEGAPGHLTLDLSCRPTDPLSGLESVAFAPWGDALLSGTATPATLYGRNSQGTAYPLVRCRRPDTRLAGPTFSPDGTTLFVNLVEAGLTLAITGPWPDPLALSNQHDTTS